MIPFKVKFTPGQSSIDARTQRAIEQFTRNLKREA